MDVEHKCENCKYYETEWWDVPCRRCYGDYKFFEQNKIFDVLDALITEAEANPEWKAVNALRCAKKEISNLK